VIGKVIRTVAERLSGNKPSPVRAIVASTIVGAAAAGVTYKALRS
jgi:hypothetical protein